MYSEVDYSVSLAEMLIKVIDRYQHNKKYYLQIALPIILIDIAVVLSFYTRLTELTPLNRVLVVQSILTLVFGVSAYIGYLIWKKRQKPLVDNAKQMLIDLNSV
jgi:amino acid permease